jgi:hypothetical protein
MATKKQIISKKIARLAGVLQTKGKLTKALLEERKIERERDDRK